MSTTANWQERDRQHLLHPLHHLQTHQSPIIVESAEGVWLQDVDGRRYLDGLSGLWNVLIGHGNEEMAAVAQQQMSRVAYSSNYAGMANLPAIELAEKMAGYAYPQLNTTFFASGGAEANESAFKTARYYWKRQGKPNKIKVIARQDAYHGVTMAAMSATGISPYWPMFEPRVAGFLHVHAPYPYRYAGDVRDGETIGQAAVRAMEEAILREGPDTVAAVIAEPVQGAGGVIVPPDDYFPRLRQICDQYEVLLIADEVITGFGRTGKWFALDHWDVQPDILSFAKGVTSGYLPLGGIQISDAIREAIESAPAGEKWMHAYTYSGHPTCCAVALKNLEIIERDGLAEQARRLGETLQDGLQAMADSPIVGNVRGLGLMGALEFVTDKETKTAGDLALPIYRDCSEKGVLLRTKGESLLFAPPYSINDEELAHMLAVVAEVISNYQ